MHPEYPIKFGKYLLLNRIAVGGMAEVFRAKLIGPKGFEKKLAIKRILPEYSQDDEFVQMFVDEARISSHLHHSNIIQIFDFGQIDHQFYIAMELVDGTNLKNLFFRSLKQGKNISRPLIYFMVSRLASALDYAHQVKVEGEDHYLQLVHRDVSPQNVLISRRGEIKITDFGIAKAAIKLTQTQPGKIQGKYSYMSPEQALGRSIDHRSDIFSLGIIFFELLSGKKVYGSSDSVDRYKQATKAEIPRLSSIIEDIPSQIDEMVMQMLSKDPKQRPNSCAEIVNTLASFLANYQEDALMRELGEVTKDLFPLSPQEKKADENLSKYIEETNSKEDIEWKGSDLEKKEPSVPKVEDTKQDFVFSAWLSKHKKKILTTLTLLVIAGLTPLAWNIFQSTQTTTTPKPPIRKPEPPVNEKPDQVAMEMELIDIENEIESIEDQIQEMEKTITQSKKPKQKPKPANNKPTSKCPSGMKWVVGGLMTVGSSPGDPLRQEILERSFKKQKVNGFCMDIYEYPNQKGQSPMTNVSFDQAVSICGAKGKKLCTETQWERACKGPNSSTSNNQFPYGNTFIDKHCNVQKHELENNQTATSPSSGIFSECKSGDGIYDLSGSVFEWTSTGGILNNQAKITKGGSYESSIYASRCSTITEVIPTTREADIGFRCCK